MSHSWWHLWLVWSILRDRYWAWWASELAQISIIYITMLESLGPCLGNKRLELYHLISVISVMGYLWEERDLLLRLGLEKDVACIHFWVTTVGRTVWRSAYALEGQNRQHKYFQLTFALWSSFWLMFSLCLSQASCKPMGGNSCMQSCLNAECLLLLLHRSIVAPSSLWVIYCPHFLTKQASVAQCC